MVTHNFLRIEEVTSDNRAAAQMLQNFPLTKTVKELKVAIAQTLDGAVDWKSIVAICDGRALEDDDDTNSKTLQHFQVKNSDTIFFVRSLEAPPPYSDTSPSSPGQATTGDKPIQLRTVFFKTIEGRSMTLETVPITMTIGEVKARLLTEKNMEQEDQLGYRFIFGGKPLADDKTVMDYGIQNESTIEVVYRLHGGLVG